MGGARWISAFSDGRIVDIAPVYRAEADEIIDATERLVSPAFVVSQAFSHHGRPRSASASGMNVSGKLLEGKRSGGRLQTAFLTAPEAVTERSQLRYC